MNKLQPLYLEKLIYNLRGGFLIRPLAIALSLGLLGAILPHVESSFLSIEQVRPLAHMDHAQVLSILSTIAEAVMTVVSIVFAILLMSLTLASMQFSPRIIASFTKDRVTQWTLGVFLGTFCYCVCAMTYSTSKPGQIQPVLTVFGATLLALISVAWLLFFIHHISQAISVNYMVDRIAMETEQMIDQVMPRPFNSLHPGFEAAANPPSRAAEVECPVSGYIRHVDHSRLVSIAVQHRVTVVVKRRVGHFIPAGLELLSVSPPERLSSQLASELLRTFDVGPSRSLQQDVEFGILQIVDIALRAISPAVNDPSTAICCIDQLGRILIRYGSREPEPANFYQPPGRLRVVMPVIDFEHLLHSAFDQIRWYAKSDLAVCLRLMKALIELSKSVQHESYQAALLHLGTRIFDGATQEQEGSDYKELSARLLTLQTLTQKTS